MTFEELLAEIASDYLNPVELPDGSKDADRNGHMRLSDLQSKYQLSSLKIQKLLVTAGVYEPVKKTSAYYTVKQLRTEGKTVEEIMEELSLSKTAVNAFLPYERGAKDLDKLGVEISGDAARKRKQRSNEERRKENARSILHESLSDEALWKAIREHDTETFLTAEGKRFQVRVVREEEEDKLEERREGDDPVGGSEGNRRSVSEFLSVTVLTAEGREEKAFWISKEEVLSACHLALSGKAEGRSVSLGDQDAFLRPVFVFLGVMEGDRSCMTTKRSLPEEERCSCCGRKTKPLCPVASFEDLLTLSAAWEPESGPDKDWLLEKSRTSKAVKAFNEEGQEGERKLCMRCCEEIYYALTRGELPPVKRFGGYEKWEDEELESLLRSRCKSAECDYLLPNGGVLKPEMFDNEFWYLFTEMDSEGTEHSFALMTQCSVSEDMEMWLTCYAREVHRLTKAGKVAANNTETDYEVRHSLRCGRGERMHHQEMVGLLELMEKTAGVIRTYTLAEDPYEGIEVNGRKYRLESLGTMTPVCVEDGTGFQSMKDREWKGGDFGFLIDGKLFSGEEAALLCSSMEGWQIKFWAEDPSGDVLLSDDALLQVRLSRQDLVEETTELLNMFSVDGKFEKEKDARNFAVLFEKNVLSKVKLYVQARPVGYGKLAGMEVIRRLKLVEGTQELQERVREILILK